jgi:hypothetical protein
MLDVLCYMFRQMYGLFHEVNQLYVNRYIL